MENIAEKILPIIRLTRAITLPFFGKAEIVAQKDESPYSVATQLDHEVESYLKAEFFKIDPTIEFAGEEFGGARDHKKFWLVDPIDGTMLFVRGIPFCTTMVALIDDGQVIFSAIYDFVNDTMYHAEKGKGSFENGKRIFVSTREPSQSISVLESDQSKPINVEIRNKIRTRSALLQMMTSGYEFALIATGKIEAKICVDPFGKDYDFAPGSLLVSEAGGVVTNIGTSTYDYRNTNFIAGNKNVVEAFTKGPSAIFPIG